MCTSQNNSMQDDANYPCAVKNFFANANNKGDVKNITKISV